MGGAASSNAAFTTWTVDEEEENKKCLIYQNKASEFICKYLFYGVPVRGGKKSKDPLSSLWLEPTPNVFESPSKQKKEGGTYKLNENELTGIVKSVPSGVLIDSKGNIKIYFTLTGISYDITISDIEFANHLTFEDKGYSKNEFGTTIFQNISPEPPICLNATRYSLTLKWTLPQPPGISQQVELQYIQILRPKLFENDKNKSVNLNWSALVTKTYDFLDFLNFKFDNLSPGNCFIFRLKYRNHIGWSQFSEPSKMIRCLADRPSIPRVPTCNLLTATAVEVCWNVPDNDYGAVVDEFLLRGRAAGDEDFVELYRGSAMSYFVVDLHAEYAYTFQVSAANIEGWSDFSPMLTVQTPPHIALKKLRDANGGSNTSGKGGGVALQAALGCRGAWRTCWDPRTEQPFYFNTITGTRQLNMPEALVQEPLSTSQQEDTLAQASSRLGRMKKTTEADRQQEETKHKIELEFRRKRYHLMRALRKYSASRLPCVKAHVKGGFTLVNALGTRSQNSSPVSISNISRNRGNRNTSANSNNDANTQMDVDDTNGMSLPFDSSFQMTSEVHDSSEGSPIPRRRDKDVLNLNLRRRNLLSDAYSSICRSNITELSRRLKVRFQGEDGIDSGGLSKETFILVSKHCCLYMGPRYRKWMKYVGEKRDELFFCDDEFVLNSSSSNENSSKANNTSNNNSTSISDETLDELEGLNATSISFSFFLGLFLGKAIFDKQLVDIQFTKVLYRHMVGGISNSASSTVNTVGTTGGKSLIAIKNEDSVSNNLQLHASMSAVKDLDTSLYDSLQWMLDNDITDVIYETFSVTTSTDVNIPLIPNGDKINVNNANKAQYITLLSSWKTSFAVMNNLTSFLTGFHTLIPKEILLEIGVTCDELCVMLNGKASVDIDELRAYCIYQSNRPDFSEDHPSVVNFFRLFREIPEDEQRLLLKFFTGSTKVPLDGYDPPLNITEGVDMDENSLPRAHTCFNQIVLPKYTSYDIMKLRVLFAIHNTEGFELS